MQLEPNYWLKLQEHLKSSAKIHRTEAQTKLKELTTNKEKKSNEIIKEKNMPKT